MKLFPTSARLGPAALALMLSAGAPSAKAQSGAAVPPGAGVNPAAAAGPAAPAAAALPAATGPTITAAAEEAAVLSLIAAIQSNAPDYRRLAPHVARALRPRLAALNARLAPLGPVEGIDLVGEGQGMKRFKVRYGAATSEWALSLDGSGRISGLSVADPAFSVAAPKPARAARPSAKPSAQGSRGRDRR
jgi:hypothetical protein